MIDSVLKSFPVGWACSSLPGWGKIVSYGSDGKVHISSDGLLTGHRKIVSLLAQALRRKKVDFVSISPNALLFSQ